MNLEQRRNQKQTIQQLEGLLAYARETGDEVEVERITKELVALVSECGDGCCCGRISMRMNADALGVVNYTIGKIIYIPY